MSIWIVSIILFLYCLIWSCFPNSDTYGYSILVLELTKAAVEIKCYTVRWSGPVQVVSMTCMTFDEVGAPARLSGGPSPATNIPVVHTLLMAIQ